MLIAKDRSVSRCAVATSSVIINAYNHNAGKCFPSFSYIAGQTHYSVRQVKKSIKEIVPKYILKLSKGHTGWANTYKPRFELLKQLKSNSPKYNWKKWRQIVGFSNILITRDGGATQLHVDFHCANAKIETF